jgi:glucosamine kinase
MTTPRRAAAAAASLGLGLDAGGTHTRWALAGAGIGIGMAGEGKSGVPPGTPGNPSSPRNDQGTAVILGEGMAPPISGQQLLHPEGRQQLAATLAELAQAVAAAATRWGAAPPAALVAGITGFDAQAMPQWRLLAAQALGMPAQQVRALRDIELTCAAAFAPGQGMVLIAGTGSIAAHVDALGHLHRAGGRGAVIDDAGSGHWIARQALQHIWRAEDAAPGSWRTSALARCVFEHIGGPDWGHTRQWVYGATRGELGALAQAVAQAAQEQPGRCGSARGEPWVAGQPDGVDGGPETGLDAAPDPVALAILQQAGRELARLVEALRQRVGPQPVALAGRVFDLHPAVEAALRQALPASVAIQRVQTPAHHAAARLAWSALQPQWRPAAGSAPPP